MEFWNPAISPPSLFKLMIKNCSKIGKIYRKLMSEASTMDASAALKSKLMHNIPHSHDLR